MPVWLEWQTRSTQNRVSERTCGFDSHHRYMSDKVKKKQPWEMNYSELYEDWASRYAFGAKGELTLNESKEIHNKWKTLGTAARNGTI